MLSKHARQDLYDLWFKRGCRLALHDRNPGATGTGLLHGPVTVRAGLFVLRGERIVNAQTIDLGAAGRSGSATHVSVWRGGKYLASARLERSATLVDGAPISFPQGSLEVTLG